MDNKTGKSGVRIRSPSSAEKNARARKKEGTPTKKAKKYTDSEKLTVCVLYEFTKSSEAVAKHTGLGESSVRYIIKNNPKLRSAAAELVESRAIAEAEEFAERLRETAKSSVEKLLDAVAAANAIEKSNAQQLAIAAATLIDKFGVLAVADNETGGGVLILPDAELEEDEDEEDNPSERAATKERATTQGRPYGGI